jgi:hypothetical protein
MSTPPTSTRRLRTSHRAAGWDHRRWSEQPLPDDVDAAYFNAAPPDQQVKEIRADERIVLENLHPEHPRLVTNLVPILPRAVAELGGAAPHEVRLRCDTLWVDTDRGTASLVWRGNLRLADAAQAGRVVVSMDAASSPAVAVGVSAPPALPDLAALHAKFGGTEDIDPAIVRRGGALPFGPGDGSAPNAPAVQPGPSADKALPGLAEAHAKFGGTTGIDPDIVRRAAVPFGAGPGAPSASVATAPAVRTEPEPSAGVALPGLAAAHAMFGGTTGIDPDIVRRAALPFGSSAGASSASVATAPAVRREPEPSAGKTPPGLAEAHAKLGGTTGIDPDIVRRAALPFGSGASAPIPPSTPLAPLPILPISAVQPSSFTQRAPEPPAVTPEAGDAPAPPAPPPLIGPLATPEMVTRAEPPPPPEPTPAPSARVPETPDAPTPAEAPAPPAVYPLERCAAIAASIARSKDEKAAILERHQLTDERWSAVEAHWKAAIQDEIGRGKSGLLSAFDAAYVEQLEAERGVVTVDEHARLVVSAERGAEGKTLEALDLPRGAMPRISRVWQKKIARSPVLARQVNVAVRRARDQ